MTARRERAALWERLLECGSRAWLYADRIGSEFISSDRAYREGRTAFTNARLALDAYEALKEADTLETLDEMGYDAECVIRQQWEAKRCGTCRWWGDPSRAKFEWERFCPCLCQKSECYETPRNWSADHGCPHWQRKDGAA